MCRRVAWQAAKQEQRRSHNIADGIRAALLMPFKSRSQEDLYAAATAAASSTPPTTASPQGTCRDDHAVAAITMTSLLLLRPDTVRTIDIE